MAFFENLAEIMGGEEAITPEVKQTFGEYDAISRAMTSPFGSYGMAFSGGSQFQPVRTNAVVEGDSQGGGLYGGDLNYTPGDSAYGGVNPSAYMYDRKEGAANLSAAVQRAQYQDYLNRFAPIENYAVGQVRGKNTADLSFDVNRANAAVVQAGQNLQGQQERSMNRFGLQYNGPSIANSNQVAGGQVAAINQAKLADEERSLGLMGGSSGGSQ